MRERQTERGTYKTERETETDRQTNKIKYAHVRIKGKFSLSET